MPKNVLQYPGDLQDPGNLCRSRQRNLCISAPLPVKTKHFKARQFPPLWDKATASETKEIKRIIESALSELKQHRRKLTEFIRRSPNDAILKFTADLSSNKDNPLLGILIARYMNVDIGPAIPALIGLSMRLPSDDEDKSISTSIVMGYYLKTGQVEAAKAFLKTSACREGAFSALEFFVSEKIFSQFLGEIEAELLRLRTKPDDLARHGILFMLEIAADEGNKKAAEILSAYLSRN